MKNPKIELLQNAVVADYDTFRVRYSYTTAEELRDILIDQLGLPDKQVEL